MGNKMCGCKSRKVAGLTLTQHLEPCRWAPLGACPDCGHDIVRGEFDAHDGCDIDIKEVVNDLLMPYPNDFTPAEEVVRAA
jgi:hypothetical protein